MSDVASMHPRKSLGGARRSQEVIKWLPSTIKNQNRDTILGNPNQIIGNPREILVNPIEILGLPS